MNTATETRYVAAVAIHNAGDAEIKYVYANRERINPILAGRDRATEFANATDANANANQAIREYAERGEFPQHMASAHVLTA